MRIVFVVHRYWPAVGGVEKYIHELAGALLCMGHEVTVVAGAHADGLPERDRYDDVPVLRYPACRSALRTRLWMLRHVALFRSADVVHVSNTHVLELFWRMVGPLVDPRKVFLTRHGMSYRCPVPESEKRRAQRSLELAAGVIHDGAFIEKWLGVKCDRCPDQGLSPPADELKPVPEPPPTSAAFVGRLEPDSGIGIYLDAVRLLVQKHGREFSMQVYGDGSLAGALRRVVRDQSLPVTFHGRTPNAQECIADACFAFIDGRMAMQEAMARRRLVFAAYIDPLKRAYVAGETFSPYLIPVGTAVELAEKVDFYAGHPIERANVIERAYAHARSLTWHRTGEAYVDLWAHRLANPRPGLTRGALLRLVVSLNREPKAPKSHWAAGWTPRVGGSSGPVPVASR